MCPLLWCRTSFKDLASVINHVSSCPWLTDAWYWCPVCCRPERFTTTEATSTATPQAVDLGKETKYNRAVSFFKNLGCRREGRSRASLFPAGSTTVNTTVEYPNTNAYSGYQIIELGDTSRSPVELDSGMVYELGDEVQCVTPEFSTVNHTPYTSSTRSPDSLEGESLAVSPPYSFPIVASESPAVGVDAQTEARPCSIGIHNVGNRALSSPVSLTRGSPILYGKDAGRSPVDLWQLDIPKTNSSPSQSTPHLQGNHQIRIGGILRSRSSSPTPVHEVEGSPSKQEPDTTQAQVGDLCDGVRAMSNEWIQRLALDTETSQLNLEQYAVAQFDLGVGALRSLFRGTIPSKFQDIFALMHVAIASAYIVREDDLAYSWNTFLESACQWQYCLFDVIEKRTFVKVMRRMCQPPVSTTSPTLPGFADNDDFLPAERATLVRLIRHLSSTGIGAAIREEGDQAQQHCTIDNEQSILLGVLRSDVIVKGCMDLLDSKSLCHMSVESTDLIINVDYGHAVIVEDLTNRQINSSWYIEQHVPGLEILDSNIVGRLQECEGLEAFRGVVNETRNLLRRGLLHSARDVEIMLVWLGKVSQGLSF